MKWMMFLVMVFASLAVPLTASANPWVMMSFQTRQVSPDDAETFRDLLQTEITKAMGVQFVRSETACADAQCATAVVNQTGATDGVYGSIGRLGEKIIVTVELVNRSGDLRRSERMSVTQIEELETVAARLAEALASNKPVSDTAELGTITTDEVAPPKRKQGFGGLALGVGALIPARGYAEVPFGVAMDLAYWYETPHFAIGPRIGVRFQADPSAEDHFIEVPFDLGAYFVFGQGNIAPFIGGGAGLRFISDTRRDVVVTGSVITTTHEGDFDEQAWALGTYVRGGVLLFRTYTVRVSLSVDYNMTFAELHGESLPQSFTTMLNVHF